MLVSLAIFILAKFCALLLLCMMMMRRLKAIQECLGAHFILVIVLLVLVLSIKLIELGLVTSRLLIYYDQLLIVFR